MKTTRNPGERLLDSALDSSIRAVGVYCSSEEEKGADSDGEEGSGGGGGWFDDDDDELMLPTDDTELDPEVLATLPISMQYEVCARVFASFDRCC